MAGGISGFGTSRDLADASPAPSALLYFATFNISEREEIAANSNLCAAIKVATAADWTSILERHRKEKTDAIRARMASEAPDLDGMRAQALSDIREAAGAYAELTDGRRSQLYGMVCRIGKYVANGIVTEVELRAMFHEAAEANGAISKHGRGWANATITSALRASRSDALPPLARRFRSNGGGA